MASRPQLRESLVGLQTESILRIVLRDSRRFDKAAGRCRLVGSMCFEGTSIVLSQATDPYSRFHQSNYAPSCRVRKWCAHLWSLMVRVNI